VAKNSTYEHKPQHQEKRKPLHQSERIAGRESLTIGDNSEMKSMEMRQAGGKKRRVIIQRVGTHKRIKKNMQRGKKGVGKKKQTLVAGVVKNKPRQTERISEGKTLNPKCEEAP